MLNSFQHDKKVIDTRYVIPNSFRDLSAENGQKMARGEMLNQVQHDKKVIDTRHVIPNSFRVLSAGNVRKWLAVRC